MRLKKLLGNCSLLVVGAIALTALYTHAAAAQPHDGWWLCPGISLHRPCLCCPNDYCPKPMPCAPCPVCCCGPNDFCGKPLPCVSPYCCCLCDDYCCKPAPYIYPCYTPPGLTCGKPDSNQTRFGIISDGHSCGADGRWAPTNLLNSFDRPISAGLAH
jgi:hypothetical protein